MIKHGILLCCTLLLGFLSVGHAKPIPPVPEPKAVFRRIEDNAVEVRRLVGHTAFVNMAALSVDGETLASACEDGTVRLWNWKTGKLRSVLAGHNGGVLGVAFSADGKTVASSGRDGRVVLWDALKGERQITLQDHAAAVSAVLYSPDGKTLTTASDDMTILIREPAGRVRLRLNGHRRPAIALAYSPDSKTLVSGGGSWANTMAWGELKSWDIESGKELWSAAGNFAGVWGVAFAPNGKTVAGADRWDRADLRGGDRQGDSGSQGAHRSRDLGGVYAEWEDPGLIELRRNRPSLGCDNRPGKSGAKGPCRRRSASGLFPRRHGHGHNRQRSNDPDLATWQVILSSHKNLLSIRLSTGDKSCGRF